MSKQSTKWVTRSRDRMYRGISIKVWNHDRYGFTAYVDGWPSSNCRTLRAAQRAAEMEVDRRIGK